jgi:hypothetical protein
MAKPPEPKPAPKPEMAKAPEPKPTPKPEMAKAPEPKPTPKPEAKPGVQAKVAPKAEPPKPAMKPETTPEPKPGPAPMPAVLPSKPERPELAMPEAVGPETAAVPGAKPAAEVPPIVAIRPEGANLVEGDVAPSPAPEAGVQPDAAPSEAPPVVAKPEPPKPMPKPAAKPAEAARPAPAGPGSDWMTWGGVAAGAIAMLLLLVVWRRRRALPNDMDVTALAEEAGADEGGFAIGGDSFEAPAEMPLTSRTSPPRGGFGAAPAAGPGLFDDEDFEKESEMDTGTPSLPIERRGAEAPTQHAGGGADIARLVRDLERRVAQLEARLDEATEARERLERQVATQAEELRVQRVAIARTQRALRGLNRSDEEQATEPALREPK